MKKFVVDYESFYDTKAGISASSQGNPNYFRDADAYILSTVDEDFNGWCGTIDECRAEFGESFWTDPNHQFWAANANFDQGWNEKYFAPTAQPWQCVLDLGAYNQLPRNLAGLAKTLFGTKVDKTIRDQMDGVDFFTLPKPEQDRVIEYCLNDSFEEMKLLKELPPMTPIEEKIAAHTRLCNRRGVHVDLELMDHDKTLLEQMRFNAFKSIPWTAGGALPLSYPAMAKYCNTRGIPVPKSRAKGDEECEDLMSDSPELSQIIGSMREFTRSNRLIKKLEMTKLRVTDDGILPLDLFYCGAPHTRRWSSRGVNIQNLDKAPTPVGEDKVWIRNWFIPPLGKKFLILDFAQIEPRCLNWLASNDELLEAIRSGYSYYEAYAKAFKGWNGKPGTIKTSLGVAAYTKLKNESLGLGYGMGANKYTTYADTTVEEAKKVVDGFRKGNPRIVALWGKLDKLVRDAAMDKSQMLELEMPTGDKLRHFFIKSSAKIGPDGRAKRSYTSYTVKGDFSRNSMQPSLWGGTLAENITQRMARDVMAEAVIRLEEAGIPVYWHAHDEVIAVVDDDDTKDEAKAEAVRIMSQEPEWAPGLPLAVDGDFAERYTKFN